MQNDPQQLRFWALREFGLMRLNAFRLECHVSIRRGPRTKHVMGLLLRCGILDSLCWRVLDCFSNQAVHIWLPRSVARKNNHRLARNPRELSDWQAVGGISKNIILGTKLTKTFIYNNGNWALGFGQRPGPFVPPGPGGVGLGNISFSTKITKKTS